MGLVRDEGGANAVEFALVLPILVVLLFGMFTGGISLNRWLQMNHAAREGVRYAATLGPGEPDWFESVALRTYEAAAGELNLADSSVTICVSRQEDAATPESYTVTGGGFSPGDDAATYIGGGSPGTSHCHADGLGSDARVQVAVTRDAQIQAVFFRLEPTLVSESLSRWEPGS